jgi:hypothetical protein
MELNDVEQQFGLKYYHWALRDFRREIAEGFPLLRLVKGTQAAGILKFLEPIPADELGILSAALVKRAHLRAVRSAGGDLSARERCALEKYYAMPVLQRWHPENPLRNAPTGSVCLKINRGKLRTLIRQQLEPLTGKPFGRASESVWWHKVEINGWSVETWIDTGSRLFQLSYSQSVKSGTRGVLVGNASLLSWLGLSGQTMWQFITDESAPTAAESLARLCSHFIGAAGELLSELPPPEENNL